MATVLMEVSAGVAWITLNRPDKFNAFNKEMALLLQALLDEAAANSEVRCIYISGSGKAFSAGQDLAELVGDNAPNIREILGQHYNPIVQRLRNLPKPVVCAVNGVAAGAGANIALCGDIVVATESASFLQAFSKIGLIPDSGGTYTLPRLIGWQKASALMMLGEKLSATDAEKIGMVFKVIADENFVMESKAIATTLAAMPTRGLALTKQALNASFTNNWEQQLTLEDELQYEAANTYDYNEGVAAFLEKRKPVFKGQ
jgi:2-(1,2-epoxy-1,2-dihydrophenyl)acetyl-CoA isomerase